MAFDLKSIQAAVSLTYDDALLSHLEVAGPQLARHGLKGTFFISDRLRSVRDNPAPWRELRRAGHELGCHTLEHFCPHASRWTPPGTPNDAIDEAFLTADLDASDKLLRDLGENRGQLSFAYPCGVTWIGKDGRSYKPLIESRFSCARGVGRGFELFRSFNRYEALVQDGQGCGAEDLIGMVKQAEGLGAWLIFMFHGVGGDHLRVGSEAHDALLSYLDSNRSRLWTAPFADIAAELTRG